MRRPTKTAQLIVSAAENSFMHKTADLSKC
jgi:hypothetical protein